MPESLLSLLRPTMRLGVGLLGMVACTSEESPSSNDAGTASSRAISTDYDDFHHPLRASERVDELQPGELGPALPADLLWPRVAGLEQCSRFARDEADGAMRSTESIAALPAGSPVVLFVPLQRARQPHELAIRVQFEGTPLDPPLRVLRVARIPIDRGAPTLPRLLLQAEVRRELEPVSAWDAGGAARFALPPEPDSNTVAVVWEGEGAPTAARLAELELRVRPLAAARTEPSRRMQAYEVLRQRRDTVRLHPRPSLRWELEVPPRAHELHFGVAVQTERYPGWEETETRFHLRLRHEGRWQELWSRSLCPARELADHGWVDVAVPLEAHAGRRVLLEWRAEHVADGSPHAIPLLSEILFAPTPEPSRRTPPPVILISADTLRPDRLSCYGGPEGLSPALDSLAAESVRFAEASSSSSFTLPSHATMLSGQHPLTHGVNRHPLTAATTRTSFLAELLREEGYLTAAYAGGGFVSHQLGFDRGFDRFSAQDLLTTADDKRLTTSPIPGDLEFNRRWCATRRLDQALDFVRAHRERPFFLFLHSFLTHGYQPTSTALAQVDPDRRRRGSIDRATPTALNVAQRDARPRDPAELERLRALYDGTVWMLDQEIGRFLDELRRMGVYERAILVFTSDHGEEFGEHRGLGHGRTLYEETVRVPMIARWPGGPRGVVVEQPVYLQDIVPSILELIAAPEPPTAIDGESFVALAEGRLRGPRTTLLETRGQLQWERYALRSDDDKLVWNAAARREGRDEPEYEWYDLRNDPTESRSLVDERPEDFARRRDLLRAALDLERTQGPQADPDEALLDELRRLGYVVDD